MKHIFQNPWFRLAVRLGIGAVFLYAGLVKIQNPQNFADSIATFRILPLPLINIVALSLPPLEIILGALLILGAWPGQTAFALTLLMAIFLLGLAQALARGIEVDCGCFGSGEPSLWKTWMALARGSLILSMAGILYFWTEKSSPARCYGIVK